MNYLEKEGKEKTLLTFASLLLISLYSIYVNQSSKSEIDVQQLVIQIIRFLLTIGLFVMVYDGKNWARILLMVLLSITILIAIIALFTINISFTAKAPFIVMIFIYSSAIYHFGVSSYKAFYNYQNRKERDENFQ
ncbi:hypothetical protein GCM10023210_40460 [Chryseobacterium ginsengisoli]|uniref:Uncharacterized protein n=1 Tax=Chryseobacterium ginsengisoli TaxID=363853 RepID=A0ABP9MTW5_9FLAO